MSERGWTDSEGHPLVRAIAMSKRFRVNLKENGKGAVSIDCTAECETHDEAVAFAVALLADTKSRLKSIGRTLVDD